MAIKAAAQSVASQSIDAATYANITLDYAHHELHSGSSFVASGTIDLAASGTVNVTFVTPDTTKWMHFVPSVVGEVETAIDLWEGFNPGTAHAGTIGVAVTAYNRNRNSATAPTMLVYSGATVGTASPGTIGTALLESWHIGSGRDTGGQDRADNEWIGKQNTTYCVQIRNFSGAAANFIQWQVDWYEHTNKE